METGEEREEKPREKGHITFSALKDRQELPSSERLSKGGVAIIECTEEIPCDPCARACRFNAIEKEGLTSPPSMDYEKCVGCAECVAACPGLGIFVVNKNFEEDRGLVYLPYEFSPAPKEGTEVNVLSREGERVGKGEIIQVREGKRDTKVIAVAVKNELAMKVRAIEFHGE